MAITAKGYAKPKKSPVKGDGPVRWSLSFNQADGTEIRERAERRGTKAAIWCREAVFERLQRERAAEAPPKR
jgi:hypothetical protein